MKTIVLAAALLLATSAQAEVLNSQYEARHQAMLKKASLEACQVNRGKLTQISSSVIADQVDQGITDYYFTTELELTVKIDQGVFDTYKVTAQTLLASAYDHDAKDWGIYSVQSITCQ